MENESKPAVWQLQTSDPELAEKLKADLHSVQDPELGYSVIDLGMIRDVVISDGTALITMLLTTPFCPYGPQLIESVRLGAERALNMPIKVELSLEPWDPGMMEDGFELNWGWF